MSVVSLEMWQPTPHQRDQLDALLGELRRVHERLGARVGLWNPATGITSTDCVVYSTEFDDMSSYTSCVARLEIDTEYQVIYSMLTCPTTPIASLINSLVLVEQR